jgi:hypothetical protein
MRKSPPEHEARDREPFVNAGSMMLRFVIVDAIGAGIAFSEHHVPPTVLGLHALPAER